MYQRFGAAPALGQDRGKSARKSEGFAYLPLIPVQTSPLSREERTGAREASTMH